MQIFALASIFITISACSPQQKQPKQRSIKDVENALKVIKERQSAEEGVVVEQSRQIKILENNKDKSNSDGMKDKIQRDIEIKLLAIEKARKNIANQNVILEQLEQTRDSLLSL